MGNNSSASSQCTGEPIPNDINVTWKKISSPFSFAERDGQASCCLGNKLYVFGGVIQGANNAISETNELLVFDTDTLVWSKVAVTGKPPLPRSAATMVGVGKKLYLYGGLNQNVGWIDELHVFDTVSSKWYRADCTGPQPSARDKLTSVAIHNNIYFFGGFGPKAEEELDDDEDDMDDDDEVEPQERLGQGAAQFGWYNDIYAFDTATNTWSQPMQMNLGVPTARAAHGMCAVDNSIVIFGGRDTDARRNDIHIFDTCTRKWDTELKAKGREPEPRSFHTTTSVGHRVVVMGGRGADNFHFADLHIFDTVTSEWLQPRVSGDLPTARGVHSASVVGDKLVLFGGSGKFMPDQMACTEFYTDTYITKVDDILKGSSLVTNSEGISSGPSPGPSNGAMESPNGATNGTS